MATLLFDEIFLQKLERLALLTRRAAAGPLAGERRSARRGQSVEFADFRPYVAGDDFRRIDWNAYARLERFFLKLFVEEQDLVVHLLVDASRSMDWGQPSKLDYARRAAAAFGYVALVGLDRVTATAVGGTLNEKKGLACFPPQRGKQQALALFRFLQSVSAGGGVNPEALLRSYAANATQPGPLILFSDLMDDGWVSGLRDLSGRGFEVTVVHILSPDESNPDINGDFRLRDWENDAEVEISADYELLAQYRRNLQAWQEELNRFCKKRGMHYVQLVTSLPLEDLMFAGLRRQRVLR